MQIRTKDLTRELKWANRFIEQKTNIPILANVLLEYDTATLRLTGTDLETAGISALCAEDGEPWKLTVPAKQLLRYLEKVTEDTVTLEPLAGHILSVSHGDNSAEIPGMDRESYPEIPNVPITRDLSGLTNAIPRTILAICAEESRFTLNGALLRVHDGVGHLVATDGHRLALCDINAGPEPMKAIIGRFALDELHKLKRDSVLFGFDDKHVVFQAGDRRIVSRKMTGPDGSPATFPDYQRVMPAEQDHALIVPTAETVKILDRVTVFADERSHAIKINVAEGKLTLTAETTSDSGKAKGAVPCDTNGTNWTCGFNAEYLQEFLKLAPETAVFRFSEPKPNKDPQKPPIYSAAELNVDGWRYVVMPMRMD